MPEQSGCQHGSGAERNRVAIERKKTSRKRIDVLLMPPLEDHELPQPERVIARAGHMLVNDAAYERWVEVAALERTSRQEGVAEQIAELSAEPHVERHAKPLLAAIDQAGWKKLRRHLLEDVFTPSIS